MNGRRLTDAQISQALRAHLPEAAAPGLRERAFAAAEATGQLRSFPSFLGALSDADPVSRRRNLLIAAALLLALAIASAAAVGAWRFFQRDQVDELSLEPPADIPAFVLSSYERLPQLPPVAFAWRDSDSRKGRVYVDRSGAVRFDRFLSADATEPSSSTILSANHRISGMASVESEAVWVEQGHEAIGEDPRVFLRTVLSADDGPGCEMERDPGEVGNGTVATGWRYVGLEYVAGRPTHHVTCGGGDLWLDIETRLILRVRHQAVDDAGSPIPGAIDTTEVSEIAFGEQPAALFEPPEGVSRMSADAYGAYLCTAGELPNEQVVGLGTREGCPTEAEATAPPEPSPTPTPTMSPTTSDCAVAPGDPSEPTGPLAWTPQSLKKDWPAPVRPEPTGGGIVQPMPLTYLDPTGDTGSDDLPCIDIRDVTVGTHDVFFNLGSNQPPDVEPSEAWIAYGVVVDDDRDGVPDWRYGIDNLPREAGDESSQHREWRTDLDTGRTEWAVEKDFAMYMATGFNSGYPGNGDREGFSTGRDGARFRFGHEFDTTGGTKTRGFKLDMPFYTWASVIVDGRVVATDYAPDSGWLVATPGATPGGTFLLGDPYPNLSMAVPEGWTVSSGSHWTRIGGGVLRRVTCGDLPRDYPPDTSYDADCASVRFRVIENWEEVCAQANEPPLGSTFDDLVTYVEGSPTIVAENVMVDGYRGMHLRGDGCGSGADVWILDVDGVRLMIDGDPNGDLLHGDVPEKAVKTQIRQMVESIHFER